MTSTERLTPTRPRTRRRLLAAGVIVAILGTFASVAYAAVSSQNTVYACFGDTTGKATSGLAEYQAQCGPNAHLKAIAAQDVVPGVTTTQPTTTVVTTTTQPSGTIVPAGGPCPNSTASSTYEGNTLTVTQAVQALYGGGFRTMADLRMFVGIGRAESSLCVRTWHYHPTQSCPGFPQPCADRGFLQINDSFWPQFPDSQVLDPIGAAQAAWSIVYQHGGSYGTWDTAGTAANQQATVAQVCAAEPTTAGC